MFNQHHYLDQSWMNVLSCWIFSDLSSIIASYVVIMGRKTKFQERRHTESHNRHSHPRDSHRRESHLRDSHRRDRELKLYILSLLLVVRIRQGRAGKI